MSARSAGFRLAFRLRFRYARDFIADGYMGEVLATTLVGSGHLWGADTRRQHAYAFDASNGATMLTVPVIHALDALTFAIADFDSVTASTAIRHSVIRNAEDGSIQPVTVPDHVVISGEGMTPLRFRERTRSGGRCQRQGKLV